MTAAKANLSEPRVDVLGMDAEHMKASTISEPLRERRSP